MKSLDTEKETIEKICNILTEETLQPAKAEAKRIVAEAEKRAQEIKEEAQKAREEILREADYQVKQQENVFRSTMVQATGQSLEAVRQQIQKQLFSKSLTQLLTEPLKRPDLIADLIRSIVQAIDKEGLAANLTAAIPAQVSVEEINKLLGQDVLKKLNGNSVVLSQLPAGVTVKLRDQQLTVDMSLESVQELVSSYIRKDLRELIFGKEGA